MPETLAKSIQVKDTRLAYIKRMLEQVRLPYMVNGLLLLYCLQRVCESFLQEYSHTWHCNTQTTYNIEAKVIPSCY